MEKGLAHQHTASYWCDENLEPGLASQSSSSLCWSAYAEQTRRVSPATCNFFPPDEFLHDPRDMGNKIGIQIQH